MGDHSQAVKLFQEALRLEPWSATALTNFLTALAEQGETWEGICLCLERLEWYPADSALESAALDFLGALDASSQLAFAERLIAEGCFKRARAFHQLLCKLHPDHPEFLSLGVKLSALPDAPPLVSAIVSTYNSEVFIRGCLESLEAQTIREQLEIIVVDSASSQDERLIVGEFQQRYGNIKYFRTRERETVYAAWNHGVRLASGTYITNANTDDRHRNDAYERMAHTLEAMPEIALAYADVLITERENETFADCHPVGRYSWLDWDRQALLYQGCFMGPQPMWRRSVHEEYGLFDESFVTSGDYEFWLRISQTNDFFHIPEVLGLYLKSPTSIEHSNRDRQAMENQRLLHMYQGADASETLILRNYRNDPAHLLEVHNRKGEELFGRGEIRKAQIIFEQILERNPALEEPRNNLGVALFQQGEIEQAINCFREILQHAPQQLDALENLGNCYKARGDYLEASHCFSQMLELEPANAQAREALDHCLQNLASVRANS